MPKIGFAHHFYTDKDTYTSAYNNNMCIEIVYVNSGTLEAKYENNTFYAPEGSIFVLFRKLPITLRVANAATHSHSTVQIELNKSAKIIKTEDAIPTNGALLPFVIMPCDKTEEIKKEIYSVISELGTARESCSFSASVKAVNIIRLIDEVARANLISEENASSLLVTQIKKYIDENIYAKLTLTQIAAHIKKTPNYINSVFKKETEFTILQYINRKKCEKISSLMIRKKLTFKEACTRLAINDVQYGKKLFIKHMGIDPEAFANGNVHIHK